MIEIDEDNFGAWPNEQHYWMFFTEDAFAEAHGILMQLYAQMMGWA